MSAAGISNQNFLESNLQPILLPAPKREKVSFDMLSRNLDRIERAVDFVVEGKSVENFEVYEQAFANLQKFAEKSAYKPLQDRIEKLEGRLSLASQFHAQDVMNAQIPARVLDWAKDTALLSGTKLKGGALIAADWSGRFAGASGRVIIKTAPIVADGLAKGATQIFQGTQAAAAVFGDIASQTMSAIPAIVKEWTWTKTALSLVGISGAKAFYNDPTRVAEKCTNAATKIFTLVDSLTDWIGSLFGQASAVLETDEVPTSDEVWQFFKKNILDSTDSIRDLGEEVATNIQDKFTNVADEVERAITDSPHFNNTVNAARQFVEPVKTVASAVKGSLGIAIGASKAWNNFPLSDPAKVLSFGLVFLNREKVLEGLRSLIPKGLYQSVDKKRQIQDVTDLLRQMKQAQDGAGPKRLAAGLLESAKELVKTLDTTEKLKKWASLALIGGAIAATQLAFFVGASSEPALGIDLTA